MKRDKYDIIFSLYIRTRDNFTCQKCGKKYPDGGKGLDCSHFWGRRAHSVRWDEENADAHCRGCHQHLSANPELFRTWKLKQMGEDKYKTLMRRANAVKKWTKKEKEQMYQDYKEKLCQLEK